MKPADFQYVRPTSLAEAVAALQQSAGDGKILAGGQSLVPLMNFRLASPGVLVDLNGIDGLSYVSSGDGQLRVGAMTRMRVLETDPHVRQSLPMLAAAASWVGHVQIRNRGTVGGSVAHADPAAEVPAVCVLAGAELIATGPDGQRSIPAADFFLGFLFTALDENEVLTEIRFPLAHPDERWGFREFAHRRGDFALAGGAVTLRMADGAVEQARVVVFGTSDKPLRSTAAEQALIGGPATPERLAAASAAAAAEAATDDPRPDASYRRTVTQTVVRRALEDAAGREVNA